MCQTVIFPTITGMCVSALKDTSTTAQDSKSKLR